MNKRQKCLLFFLFFFATAGVVQVDRAYSEMMDKEMLLTLKMRRVDDAHIRVSLFGYEQKINTDEVVQKWKEVEESVEDTLDGMVASVKGWFYEKEGETPFDSEPFRAVDFHVETL